MILTCPACSAQYNLSAEMLGTAGRTVRCVSCNHTWFQAAEGAPLPEPPAQSLTEALDSILEKDDAAFEAILADANSKPKPAPHVEPPKHASPEAPPPVMTPIEESRTLRVMPPPESTLPVVTHNPFGVNATVFGILVFCLCSCVTLMVLLTVKGPLIKSFPQTALLYRTLGVTLHAPGEGLRISDLTAEEKMDGDEKVIFVEGKITNMSKEEVPYPALHISLKDHNSREVKSWDVNAKDEKIVSGDEVPVKMQLGAPEEEGSAVEISVSE